MGLVVSEDRSAGSENKIPLIRALDVPRALAVGHNNLNSLVIFNTLL
jgi:hypothetical protein